MLNGKSFREFDLSPSLLQSLDDANFKNASPIQELTIAPILQGEDIFAQAETGSGKTGAFVIPIIEKIIRNHDLDNVDHKVLYVVLSPTRELAQQTHKVFNIFGESLGLISTCLIGGESIEKQVELLKKGTHILIATPGRLGDLIGRSHIDLKDCEGVVFDEVDRLFDMGFQKDLEFALSKIPSNRQLIMLSATNNVEVLNTAYKYNSVPIEIKLNADDLMVDHIVQKIAMVSEDEKMRLLVSMLRAHEDVYSLVFCNTQFQTHLVAEWLRKMEFKSMAISGRLPQNKRTKLMEDFRNREVTILVCTDVAARGLDIRDVNFIVNYDLPNEPENYVHRIGRTGRAGNKGEAVSFCGHRDCENLEAIYELINTKIEKMDLTDSNFAKDLPSKPRLDSKTLKVSTESNYRNSDRTPRGHHSSASPQQTNGQGPSRSRSSSSDRPAREHNNREQFSMKESCRSLVNNRYQDKDKYSFSIKSANKAQADKKAMLHLGITDPLLLGSEVLESGRKKFILFGPRIVEYRYYVKPIFKRLLTPFLEEIIKRSDLDLTVRVSFKEPHVRVSFNGDDENMLLKNRSELLLAFEHLVHTYIARKIIVAKGLKLSIRVDDYRGDRKAQFKDNSDIDEKYLEDLVSQTIAKIKESQAPVMLEPLNPKERRLVHQLVSENADYKTTSIGDGRLKKIEISLN